MIDFTPKEVIREDNVIYPPMPDRSYLKITVAKRLRKPKNIR